MRGRAFWSVAEASYAGLRRDAIGLRKPLPTVHHTESFINLSFFIVTARIFNGANPAGLLRLYRNFILMRRYGWSFSTESGQIDLFTHADIVTLDDPGENHE